MQIYVYEHFVTHLSRTHAHKSPLPLGLLVHKHLGTAVQVIRALGRVCVCVCVKLIVVHMRPERNISNIGSGGGAMFTIKRRC